MTTTTTNTTTKTAIITIPNRAIKSGEYGASYGSCDTHIAILKQLLSFRKANAATMTEEVKGDSIVVTISYTGSFGKRNLLEVEYMCEKGFITNINY